MFVPRIIPVLLIDNGKLVKSIAFNKLNYIGDPLNAVKIFNEYEVDELMIMDISASRSSKKFDLMLLDRLSYEARMPLAVGGGIKNMNDIQDILKCGAEKVILNNSALFNKNIVKEAVNTFGSSSISVCIDVKKNIFGKYHLYSHFHKKVIDENFHKYINDIADFGAGEIILQSVNNDGTYKGYDVNLYQDLSKSLKCPLVALGGAKHVNDFLNLWNHSSVNAFAAASLFVYFGPLRGVLINYQKIEKNDFRNKFLQT
jgi:cyclase